MRASHICLKVSANGLAHVLSKVNAPRFNNISSHGGIFFLTHVSTYAGDTVAQTAVDVDVEIVCVWVDWFILHVIYL